MIGSSISRAIDLTSKGYREVIANEAGVAYANTAENRLVIPFTSLTSPAAIQDLVFSGMKGLGGADGLTLITDASCADAANFETMDTFESRIVVLAGTLISEWRHVPSGSPALRAALLRLLQSSQARGGRCGIYASLEPALVGPQDPTCVFHDINGELCEGPDYLIVRLREGSTDLDLARIMESAAIQLGYRPNPCLVVQLPSGPTGITRGGLMSHVDRILEIGSAGSTTILVDPARQFPGDSLRPATHGILHRADDLDTALAHREIFSLVKFRKLPAEGCGIDPT